MSNPTIVVSPSNVPSSIQIATPFSYTFSNSGSIPAGSNVYSPSYEPYVPSQVTFTTTGIYSSNNTLVTTTTGITQVDPIYGLVYSDVDVTTGSEFTFKIPYSPTPARGNIGFSLNLWYMYVVDDTQRYISNGSNTFEYSNGDTITYRKRSDGGFDVLCNSTVKFIETSLFSIQFNTSFSWDPYVYPEWSSNYYSTGQQVTALNKYYEAVVNSTPDSVGIAPYDSNNYTYWLPVTSAYPQWLQLTNYLQGERVTYNNLDYESLPFNNLSAIPPNRPDVWQLLTPTTYSTWNISTQYTQGSFVTYNGLNYQSLIFSNQGNTPTALSNYIYWKPTDPPSNPPVTFTITAPNKIVYFPETFPLLFVSSVTSTEILPFITGNGTTELTFSGSNGFQGIPSSNLTLFVFQSVGGNTIGTPSSNTITVTPITLTTTPTLESTLTLYTYQPFSYTYSIPTDAVNVLLQYDSNVTSSNLVPYISFDTFASTVGLTIPGTTTLEFDALLSNISIGSNRTTITTLAPVVISTPPIPTGSLNLFKYEPFTYVFTLNPESVGLVLQFSRSSSQITPYCTLSADKLTLTYSGTYLNTSSSVVNLLVDVLYGTTIISTTTIRISIGRGRFFPPASNTLYDLYQNEPLITTFGSNPVFLTVAEINSIVTIPSLPNGISFGSNDSNTWILQGTPTLPVAQNTYTAFGSNSSNGNIVSTPILIRVNAQQVIVSPSSTSVSNLIVGTAITPVQFVARQPTASILSFQYTWTSLPDGIVFQDMSGSNISQGYGSNTIQLAGSPTLTAAKFFASNSLLSFQTRLTATQIQTNGTRLTGSSLITFSFGETVLFADPVIPSLYATESINSKNVFFSADTFFDGMNAFNIQSITAASLPPGLSLSAISLSNRVQLIGTPTTVGTADYSFTAINSNSISRTQSFTIPILPDIVSFGSDTPIENTAYSYIVSKPITSIAFSATSSANKTPLRWTLSLPEAYGLVLSSTTGSLVYLVGTPTLPLVQTAVTITVTDQLEVSASRTILITIENDVFTWPTYTPIYGQNKPIEPFSFDIITASGRLIQSYSVTGLPFGLSLSPAGVLSGTLLSGSGKVLSLSCSGTQITFVLSSTLGYNIGQTISITKCPSQTILGIIYVIAGDYVIANVTPTTIVCSSTLPSSIETETANIILKSGILTLSAFTGYYSPPTYIQSYTYTIIPDNVLTLINSATTVVPLTDTNGVLTFSISNVFSAISYSGLTATNKIYQDSIEPNELNPIITLVNNVFSGRLPQLPDEDPSFTFNVTGESGNVESDVSALLLIPDRTTAYLTLRRTPGFNFFREPPSNLYTLFQYCPINPIPISLAIEETGFDFTYYYSIASNLPLGMVFTAESTGRSASISGIPVTYSDRPVSITVYAANGPNVVSNVISFRILTPNFINPQVGAGAYTSLLKSDVEGNAAQNARDQRVFPTSDPLAGPLMAPRAPDVITQSNCFLGLCKKPCPTCRTTM